MIKNISKNFMNILSGTTTFINKIFNSYIYIVLFATLTFVCWFYSKEATGILIMLIAAVLIFLCCKDPSPLIPLVCFACIIFSKNGHEIELESLLLPISPFLILGFIFFLIKNKTSFFGGRYFYGILLGSIGASFGGFLFRFVASEVLVVVAVCFGLLLLYVFFSTYSKNIRTILFNTLFAMSIIIMLQTLIFYIEVPNIDEAIISKSLNVGWGISNVIGLYLSMFLPVTFYFAAKAKRFSWFFICFSVIQLVFIYASLSRGNMLFATIFYPILLIACFKSAKNKLSVSIGLILSIIVGVVIIIIFKDFVISLIERLISFSFDDNGRLNRYELAISDFKHKPIFGISFFYHMENGLPYWYHNTILQILGSLGLFGFIMFIPFFVQRYYFALKYFNYANFTMICMIILSALYAFMDVNFFFITNAIITIFIYSAMEKEKDTINIFKLRFLRSDERCEIIPLSKNK